MPDDLSRRQFVTVAGGALGLALLPGLSACAPRAGTAGSVAPATTPLSAGATILFQGDSITDAGRSRQAADAPNSGAALGTGYPLLVASDVTRDRPELGLRFFNRGVSGDKVPDLAARWQGDTLAVAPDVLSVLVGVNDFWHRLLRGYTGTVADYEREYAELLTQTKRALPRVQLVVMEPFVLRTGAVDARWFPELDERRAAAHRVAERTGATWVPLQGMLDDLARRAAPRYWLADGVHPTPAGHAAIARQWRAVTGI